MYTHIGNHGPKLVSSDRLSTIYVKLVVYVCIQLCNMQSHTYAHVYACMHLRTRAFKLKHTSVGSQTHALNHLYACRMHTHARTYT